MKNTKMRTKNILVSFLAVLALVCIATATVSASDITNKDSVFVKIDGIDVGESYGTPSINAGDTVSINVRFTSLVCDSDVTVEAELEGGKVDAQAVSSPFDVETDGRYSRTLSLKVPNELKDKLSNTLDLIIKIDGKEYRTELNPISLKVQRTPYDVAIKSVSASQTVKAGGSLPVEIVLKNIGYNDLSDLYVTVKIPALGVEKTGYFGDLVALECADKDSVCGTTDPNNSNSHNECCKNNEDNTDTVSGKLTLDIPFGVKAGTYSVEVEVSNEDTTSTAVGQIVVENDFETTVYKSGNSVWIVNPTDNVVGYRIVAESPAIVSDSMIFVPAGASKSVAVDPNTKGEYSFNVNVFTIKGDLVETLAFSGNTVGEKETQNTNPIVILTVILAIIFIVLLVVLIVLIGRKPEKSGEFGESYY
jgi:hypothetical protein